jgi:hypothetical protein
MEYEECKSTLSRIRQSRLAPRKEVNHSKFNLRFMISAGSTVNKNGGQPVLVSFDK